MSSFILHLTRLKDLKLLHENIIQGNLGEVKEFIKKYPRDRKALSKNNESAVAVAVKSNRLEVYELLLVNGFRLGPHEELSEILCEMDEPPSKKRKKELFEIHKRCAIDSQQKHLLVLRSKCRLIHSTPESKGEEFYGIIMKVLEELNTIEEIEPLMKTAACFDGLIIIFDFNRNFVDEIDPTKHDGVLGTTYSEESVITIGAKGLLDAATENKVQGTLAHELCHFAVNLTFSNNCKPFAKDDEGNSLRFNKVVEDCEAEKLEEEIISRVFNCKSQIWIAELIARAPHLLARYKNNPEKLQELRQIFKSLFDFYNQFVLPQIIKKLPDIEAKFKVKEINEICGITSSLNCSEILMVPEAVINFTHEIGSVKKFQLMSSNCVKLTMILIYQRLEKEKNCR